MQKRIPGDLFALSEIEIHIFLLRKSRICESFFRRLSIFARFMDESSNIPEDEISAHILLLLFSSLISEGIEEHSKKTAVLSGRTRRGSDLPELRDLNQRNPVIIATSSKSHIKTTDIFLKRPIIIVRLFHYFSIFPLENHAKQASYGMIFAGNCYKASL